MSIEMASTTTPFTSAPPAAELGVWQRFSFGAMRALLGGLTTLFGLRGLYLIGQGFGTLEWLVNYKRRRKFRHSLKTVCGDALAPSERRRRARRFFMRTRCDKILYLIFDKLPRELAVGRFEIRGRELLDRALEGGRGCFVALSHYGAHHVGGMLLSLNGYQVAGVRDPNEGAIRRYVQNLLARRYVELRQVRYISADAYPREIYRCFEGGCVLGAALDVRRVRDERRRTVRVRLFGQECDFVVGTALIAARCGAQMLQGFVVSEKDFRYRLDLLGPLMADPAEADSPERLQGIMQTYADNIESYLGRYPDHLSRV